MARNNHLPDIQKILKEPRFQPRPTAIRTIVDEITAELKSFHFVAHFKPDPKNPFQSPISIETFPRKIKKPPALVACYTAVLLDQSVDPVQLKAAFESVFEADAQRHFLATCSSTSEQHELTLHFALTRQWMAHEFSRGTLMSNLCKSKSVQRSLSNSNGFSSRVAEEKRSTPQLSFFKQVKAAAPVVRQRRPIPAPTKRLVRDTVQLQVDHSATLKK